MNMSNKLYSDEIDVDKFTKLVLHYGDNAKKYLEKKDYQKASEMIWGAMSCTIKAVAAKENKSIKSHAILTSYAIELAERLHDEMISNSISNASLLHRNFYEANLDPDTISKHAKLIFRTIDKLMGMIKDNKKNSLKEYAVCDKCGVVSQLKQDIENKFGFCIVNGTSMPQSRCKNCRDKH